MRTRKLQFFNFLIDSGTHWIFICWIVMSPGVWRSLHGSSEGGTIKLMRKRDMNLQLTRVYETLLCDAMSCERALKLRNKTKSQLCCCLTQPEWEYLFHASCAGCCVVKGSHANLTKDTRRGCMKAVNCGKAQQNAGTTDREVQILATVGSLLCNLEDNTLSLYWRGEGGKKGMVIWALNKPSIQYN